MRTLPSLLLLPSLALAACLDTTESVDGDFSCAGTSLQTGTSGPLAVSGRIVNEDGGAAIADAWIEIHALADDALLANGAATSADPVGTYAISMPVAPHAYRKIIKDGFLDAYTYDAAPMTGEPQLASMFTRDGAAQQYRSVGLSPGPQAGMLLVVVRDCAGKLVRGATVSVAGSAGVLYLGDDTLFHPEATTTSGNSAALVLGVPAGPVNVEIQAGDVTYRAQPVASHADAFVRVDARP